MANTTKLTDKFLQIKGLDADWTLAQDLPGFAQSGLVVKSIVFHPSAANDVAIIKVGKSAQTHAQAIATTTTAPEIMHAVFAGTTDQRIKNFGDEGTRMWPFIDISDWTLNTAANARVDIELA